MTKLTMNGYIKKQFLTGDLRYIALQGIRSNEGSTPYRTLNRIRDKGIKLDAIA